MGALAPGAQRSLPTLQQIYPALVDLNIWGASLPVVIELHGLTLLPLLATAQPLVLQRCIPLQAVRVSYARELLLVLQGVDLEKRRGDCIGLIGGMGSGKSTLVGLMIGLLVPRVISLLVDHLDLKESAHADRLAGCGVAHVLQRIYVADNFMAENITLGVPKHRINLARVR